MAEETQTTERRTTTNLVRIPERELHGFVARALEAVDVAPEPARIVADVLVAADRRGIESHGVARLRWFYVDRIRNGRIVARPDDAIVRERAVVVGGQHLIPHGKPKKEFCHE